LIAWFGIVGSGCQKAPEPLLESAVSALTGAAQAQALRHAEPQYREAEGLLKQGRTEMARQNGRLPFLRDYHMADSLLQLALFAARRAESTARERMGELQARAENEHEALSHELSSWRAALDGSLRLYQAERYWAAANVALTMTESLMVHGEDLAAIETAVAGRQSIGELSRVLAAYADDGAQKMDHWRTWVRETLTRSRNAGAAAIIVDKSAHLLYLVRAGQVFHTYHCELGYNSAYQKFFAGDGATPEGKYKITVVKKHGSTFYKALLIDFPNTEDKRRFARNLAEGIISEHARIGANIEIHGEGGRNSDWTDGCVALSNADMDHLMQYVTTGTPVTIVRQSDEWP